MSTVKGILNGVWKVVSVAWIGIVVAGFVDVSKQNYPSPIGYVVMYAFLSGLLIAYIAVERFVCGMRKRCPFCKKMFALKRTGKEYVESEQISVLKEVKRYNNYHEKIGTQQQYVPGTREWHRKVYTCKCCGKKTFNYYCKSFANM